MQCFIYFLFKQYLRRTNLYLFDFIYHGKELFDLLVKLKTYTNEYIYFHFNGNYSHLTFRFIQYTFYFYVQYCEMIKFDLFIRFL